MRRSVVATVAVVGGAVLVACDPCAGTIACRVDARVSATGKVIDFESGRGASGVQIVFRRTAGPTLAGDSLVVRTDDEGRFVLRADVQGSGAVIGELTVRPPTPLEPYRVRGVRIATGSVAGAGAVLPTFVTRPYVDFVGEALYRRSGGAFAYSTVQFRRTGGARLASGDLLTAGAGLDGYFFLNEAVTGGDTVVGDLSVGTADFPRPFVVPGLRLPVRFTDRLPSLDRTFRLGSALDYVVEVRLRPANVPAALADVEFRRTGGIALQSPTFTGRTDAGGRVALRLTPVGEAGGEVVGDLTVRSPSSPPFVITNLRLRSYDADDLPFYGVVGVGYQAVAVGELTFRGDRTPLGDTEVEFVRTGGLPTRPERLTVRTLADGRFGLSLATDAVGEVTGDLSVRTPGQAAPTVIRGVRLQARGDDSVRFAGRWGVGAQLLYVGQLTQRATNAPAAGWTVRFRRTGGIPLVRDTSSARSVDWGGFEISPPTRTEGIVEGELTAVAPDGLTTSPLGPVRLRTAADDSVRFVGGFRVGPSLLYVGELLRADTGRPIADARIEFRRTGGIAVAESLLVERSNVDGRFRLAPTPLASGEVVGDLRIVPPAPLRDTVFTNVRLTTFDTDEVRLRDVWRLAPPR